MGIWDIFYPKKCLECKKEGSYICTSCLKKVRPSEVFAPNTICLWKYEGVIRKAIIALKYRFASEIAQEFSRLIAGKLKKEGKWPKAVLVPIPLHKRREMWRGFNQTEEIGKLMAANMHWKFVPDLLIRTKHNEPQVKFTREERVRNVKNIFQVNFGYELRTMNSVLLFDDVYTTGSTMHEAEKALKKAGAKFVFKLAIAG